MKKNILHKIREVKWFIQACSFRIGFPVTETFSLPGLTTFPICPRCKSTFEREYQSFCDRCGQKLNWDKFDDATIIIRFRQKFETSEPSIHFGE